MTPFTHAERIEHIRAMMLSGEWQRGKSAASLAAAWGISQKRVEDASTEASRQIRAALDPAEMRARILGIAEGALLDAQHEEIAHKRVDSKVKVARLLGEASGVLGRPQAAAQPAASNPDADDDVPFGFERDDEKAPMQ